MGSRYKRISVEYFNDKTKNTDRPIAISLYEGGKGGVCSSFWLTKEDAENIKNQLEDILKKIK